MAERKTRYGKVVNKETEDENPFSKSNRTLKSPQPDESAESGQKVSGTEDTSRESSEKADALETLSGQTYSADAEKETVSRRLNISDITEAAAQKGKKKGGRSRTFYMQDAMYEKLSAAAEKNGIKPSQLLHIILENVLEKM